MFGDAEHFGQFQLAQTPIGDVANVFLDVFGRHALDRAKLKRELDKLVFQADNRLAHIDDVVGDGLGHAARFFAERVIQFDHAFAMQAFIADRPGHDLAHALHLVEARKVHQHREAGE